jgi:predicted nucleic acid-binding protein
MKVLVDSTIWSLGLRRTRPEPAVADELQSLVRHGRVAIIGPIRQEMLSGLRERAQFERLRARLSGFPDTEITSGDYIEAAAFSNECRRHGIQGSHTDFLICAVAAGNSFSIFTTDDDFARYAKYLPITLYDS